MKLETLKNFERNIILRFRIANPTKECNFSAINIPSIAAALSIMKKQILNASLLLSEMHQASVSLEEIILNTKFVEKSSHFETNVLAGSFLNLEVAIYEIQERMKSLEVSLSGNAIIPDTLSTVNDISIAFYIAVNSPIIDWSLAETALERCFILGNEDIEKSDMNENRYFLVALVAMFGISIVLTRTILKVTCANYLKAEIVGE